MYETIYSYQSIVNNNEFYGFTTVIVNLLIALFTQLNNK